MKTKHCNALILMLSCLAWALCGCGSGSSSGEGGGSNPPPPTGDFSISVTPSTAGSVAGGLTQPIVVTVSGTNGFSSAVTISTSLPAGFTCAVSTCSGQLVPGSTLQTQYAAGGSVAAGAYQVTFTGVSGNLSHQATATINVTNAATLPNRSGMVFTADFLPASRAVIYDKVHDQIFLSNLQLSEVDVVSPQALQIVRRIPIPSPTGLDLSPDNSVLYVGTSTQNVFEVSTSSLQVTARDPFSGSSQFLEEFPSEVVALADGTLAIEAGCGTINPCSTATGFFIYSPKTGKSISPPGNGGAYYAEGHLVPSADRKKVFIANGSLSQYDVASGEFTLVDVPATNDVAFIAPRPDGAGYAVIGPYQSGSGTPILFLDQNFNLLGSYTSPNAVSGIFYSSDSTKLYLSTAELYVPPAIGVLDGNTYQFLGQIPSENSPEYGFTFWGIDGQNRLLGLDSNLLVLIDVSLAPTTLSANYPTAGIGGEWHTLSPDNSSGGYSTTFSGTGFTQTPQIAFNGTPATNVQLSSSDAITLTAPALQGVSQADVNVLFPSGYFLLAPSAYAYRPTVLYTDGDASAENGGSTLTLYGYGFDFDSSTVSVAIGGAQASKIAAHGGFISPYPVPLNYVTVAVPAGTEGTRDITITTPGGATTVSNGFSYLKRSDFPLPSTAAPFQMILDKPHNQLLWTDTNSNSLVVYSLTSGAIEQTLNLGSEPAGLAITPDGSKILVVLFAANTLNVYASGTLDLLQSTPTPGGAVSGTSPIFVAAVANQKAFLLSTFDGYGIVPVYEYDIASNSFTKRNDVTADESAFEAASSDGSTAFVSGGIWNSATDSFSPALLAGDYSRALSADGAVISEYRAVYDKNGNLDNVAGMQKTLEDELDLNSVPGQKVNATGSLAYLPESDRIRVMDVRHGKLIRTIMLPDGLSSTAIDGMAIDPDGQALYVLTQTGLTTLTFGSDPLSIGEAEASGNQLTILGSGFQSGATVQLDGSVIPSTIQDSQHITATPSSLSAGGHNVTILLPSGEAYSLDNALDSSAAATTAITRVGAIRPLATPDSTTAPRSFRQHNIPIQVSRLFRRPFHKD